MTTEPDEDLVRWFGNEGARVVQRALLRALRRAKADGQRAMMTSSAPRLSFSDGRRALVRATLVASAGTRREIARNSEGRSFHFEIRHVKSEGAAGKAIAHEAYIERESATEKLNTASAKHQGYLENDEKLETVGQPSAFGTIGDTLKQRQRFWKAFARSLKPRSRVQHRIIASLPHELSPGGRRRAVEAFCAETFEARGIPYFAALHAPTGENDDRNFHVHIVFAARPAQLIDGVWDFEMARPQRQNPQMRAELQKIPVLRKRFAEHVNEQINREGAGLPYVPGKIGLPPKHNLLRTPKALLNKERTIEKAHMHVRRVFENEIIETRRQFANTSIAKGESGVRDGLHLSAAAGQRKKLRRGERLIERAVGAMERAVTTTGSSMAVERTIVAVIERAEPVGSPEEVALLGLMRAELDRDIEEAEKALIVERRRFARRLWKIGRQIRNAIAPERRQALPMMRAEALEKSVTRTLSSRLPADRPGASAARAKPTGKKPGGRDSNTWSR